jgi:hypothetical protein
MDGPREGMDDDAVALIPGYGSLASIENPKAADGDRLAGGPLSAEVLTLRVHPAALL